MSPKLNCIYARPTFHREIKPRAPKEIFVVLPACDLSQVENSSISSIFVMSAMATRGGRWPRRCRLARMALTRSWSAPASPFDVVDDDNASAVSHDVASPCDVIIIFFMPRPIRIFAELAILRYLAVTSTAFRSRRALKCARPFSGSFRRDLCL